MPWGPSERDIARDHLGGHGSHHATPSAVVQLLTQRQSKMTEWHRLEVWAAEPCHSTNQLLSIAGL